MNQNSNSKTYSNLQTTPVGKQLTSNLSTPTPSQYQSPSQRSLNLVSLAQQSAALPTESPSPIAKITAFISDWSLKIKWTHWNNRKWASGSTIEIPQECRADQIKWKIRKEQHSDPVLPKKRSKGLLFNPNKLQKNEPVTFWSPICECLDYCSIVSHGQIKTGKISTNDPFVHACVVEMDDSSEMLQSVPYCYLKEF